MNKMSKLLASNKFFVIVFGLSLVLVVIGILLILSSSSEENPSSDSTLIESLGEAQSLINSAGQSQASASNLSGDNSSETMRGSEAWCEQMMLKNDRDWTESDTQLFSQKCL